MGLLFAFPQIILSLMSVADGIPQHIIDPLEVLLPLDELMLLMGDHPDENFAVKTGHV